MSVTMSVTTMTVHKDTRVPLWKRKCTNGILLYETSNQGTWFFIENIYTRIYMLLITFFYGKNGIKFPEGLEKHDM